MKANTCLPNARGFAALLFSALLLTGVGAEPVRPDAGKRPPANLKLDQVDSVKGTKRVVTPGRIEYPNARRKDGAIVKWEGPDFDAAKAPRAKAKSATSGDEAGTLKGTRSNLAPNSASGGSLQPRKPTAQYNPKELSVDKHK